MTELFMTIGAVVIGVLAANTLRLMYEIKMLKSNEAYLYEHKNRLLIKNIDLTKKNANLIMEQDFILNEVKEYRKSVDVIMSNMKSIEVNNNNEGSDNDIEKEIQEDYLNKRMN